MEQTSEVREALSAALVAEPSAAHFPHLVRLAKAPLAELRPALEPLLTSREPPERAVAADVLGALAGLDDPERREYAAAWLRRLVDAEDDPRVLPSMVTSLGHLRDESLLEKVVALREHPSAAVREALAFALSGAPSDRPSAAIATALVALCRDETPSVREWAVFGLRVHPEVGGDAVTDVLLGLVEDDDLRCEALEALGLRGHRPSVARALEECDPSDDLVLVAGQIADAEILSALIELRDGEWSGDRDALAEAIASASR